MINVDALCVRCGKPILWWPLTQFLCGYCRLLRDLEAIRPQELEGDGIARKTGTLLPQ